MGNIGIAQILIIAVVVLVLFGRGRISEMMGDFGKGVKSFRKGLNDDDDSRKDAAAPRLAHDAKPASETIESTAVDKTAS